MATREYQTMSQSEKNQSNPKERKIYPLTGEIIDRADVLARKVGFEYGKKIGVKVPREYYEEIED